jgi:hypothetical protein
MEKYLWSNWIHLHYSIDILEGKLQNKGYITEKLTIINKESGGWTKGNKLFELINQEFLIINNMKNKGYDPSIQIEFFKKNYKMYLSQIPFSKEKGKMTIDFKLLECKEYFDKKLLIIVMFLTPNFIYKIAFKVKRKVVLK